MRFVLALFVSSISTFAQDPTVTLPHAYHQIFENETFKVIRVRYAPGERLPVHAHPEYPTVYVYLTDSGPVKFEHTDIDALVRRPVKTGTFRVSPGRPEKHGVVNQGNIPSEFLRVELKTIPFGVMDLSRRVDKPFDLQHPGRTREFTHPKLTVDRLIGPIAEPPSPAGHLLVYLAPQPGTVRWCAPGERVDVKAGGHALRIAIQ